MSLDFLQKSSSLSPPLSSSSSYGELSFFLKEKCYVTKENRKYPKRPFTIKIIPKNGHVQHCS